MSISMRLRASTQPSAMATIATITVIGRRRANWMSHITASRDSDNGAVQLPIHFFLRNLPCILVLDDFRN